MNSQDLRKAISDHIKKWGEVKSIVGLLVYCAAYVKKEERLPGGLGHYTWFYGLNYPWKGRVIDDLIDVSIIAKRVFIEWARFLYKVWYLLPVLYFRRKHIIIAMQRVLRNEPFRKAKRRMRYADFSPSCGEMLKVGTPLFDSEEEKELFYWAVFALEYDNCYRLIMQDAFGLVNKIALLANPRKELWYILDMVYKRGSNKNLKTTIGDKFKIFIVGLKALTLIPKYRKKVVKFLMDINLDRVRMDEADWYYCCRYNLYDFGGWSYGKRLTWVKEYDKEVGNFIMCDHEQE